MATHAIVNPAENPEARGDAGAVDELDEFQHAAVRDLLHRNESILWAARGIPRPLKPIPVFPAFFAAFLIAFSGFALMVMFGIQGMQDVGLAQRIVLLSLAPALLGGLTAVWLAGAWARHGLWQGRVGRSFYLVTDRRAIAAVTRFGSGQVAHFPWEPGLFDDTRCIDHGDEPGAVYFVLGDEVIEPSWGFEGIREPRRVDALIREVLLHEKPGPVADLREL
jgi:hypothetical protein